MNNRGRDTQIKDKDVDRKRSISRPKNLKGLKGAQKIKEQRMRQQKYATKEMDKMLGQIQDWIRLVMANYRSSERDMSITAAIDESNPGQFRTTFFKKWNRLYKQIKDPSIKKKYPKDLIELINISLFKLDSIHKDVSRNFIGKSAADDRIKRGTYTKYVYDDMEIEDDDEELDLDQMEIEDQDEIEDWARIQQAEQEGQYNLPLPILTSQAQRFGNIVDADGLLATAMQRYEQEKQYTDKTIAYNVGYEAFEPVKGKFQKVKPTPDELQQAYLIYKGVVDDVGGDLMGKQEFVTQFQNNPNVLNIVNDVVSQLSRIKKQGQRAKNLQKITQKMIELQAPGMDSTNKKLLSLKQEIDFLYDLRKRVVKFQKTGSEYQRPKIRPAEGWENTMLTQALKYKYNYTYNDGELYACEVKNILGLFMKIQNALVSKIDFITVGYVAPGDYSEYESFSNTKEFSNFQNLDMTSLKKDYFYRYTMMNNDQLANDGLKSDEASNEAVKLKMAWDELVLKKESLTELLRDGDTGKNVQRQIDAAKEAYNKYVQDNKEDGLVGKLIQRNAFIPIVNFRKIKKELQLKPKAWWGYMNAWMDVVGRYSIIFDPMGTVKFKIFIGCRNKATMPVTALRKMQDGVQIINRSLHKPLSVDFIQGSVNLDIVNVETTGINYPNYLRLLGTIRSRNYAYQKEKKKHAQRRKYQLLNYDRDLWNKASEEISDNKESESKQVVSRRNSAELEYIKFLLFPEFTQPVRIPRLFPLPTHLFKASGSQTLTAIEGNLYIVWSPKLRHYSPALGVVNGAVVTGLKFSEQVEKQLVHESIDVPTGFDNDHVQCTAAVLKVIYQGDIDDLSGRIEVGLVMHDEFALGPVVCVGQDSIKQTYMYECHKLSKGIRCLYIPINQSMIEDFGQGTFKHNYAYHINISGANPDPGSIRLDWEYFFEGHPDYTVYNQYLPVKGPTLDSGLDVVIKTAPKLMDQLAIRTLDEGYYSDQSNWFKKVVYGLKTGMEGVAPYAPYIADLVSYLLL